METGKRASLRILGWTVLHRLACILLLVISSRLQSLFDSSPRLQLELDSRNGKQAWLTGIALPFLRWDTLHFLGMASPRPLPLSDMHPESLYSLHSCPTSSGLNLEQSLAFQPAVPWLLRVAGTLSGSSDGASQWDPARALVAVSLLATIASCLSPLLLFHQTWHLCKAQRIAYLAAILSILSTSPMTLISPTPEPFFSLFALLGHAALNDIFRIGMPCLARRLTAALFYMLATAFRANGVLLSGFLVWDVYFSQRRSGSARRWTRLARLSSTFFYVFVSTLPLLLQQAFAYSRFCSANDPARPWCRARIPSSYAFVQSYYWDVGPFRYWKLAQLPNWLLAAPVLGTSARWIVRYYTSAPREISRQTLAPLYNLPRIRSEDDLKPHRSRLESFAVSPALLPHAHFTFVTLLLLVVTSHVQIALRFASPGGMPAFWWGIASLLLEDGTFFKGAIVPYLVAWNAISIVLQAGFYPPA